MIWRGRNEPQGPPAPDPRLQQQPQQPPQGGQAPAADQQVEAQQPPPPPAQPPQQQPQQPQVEPVPAGRQAAAPEQQPEQGQVGTRVEQVLGAAEQAASGIRDDAQEWARSYLEESRRRADEIASQRIQELTQL